MPGMSEGHLPSALEAKELFQLRSNEIFLNCASRSPLLKSVEKTGICGLQRKRTPWAMADTNAERNTARCLFARLIGASKECISVVPSTSYATSLIARSLAKSWRRNPIEGQTTAERYFVVLSGQMSSNVLSWQWLCRETGIKLLVVPRPSSSGRVPAVTCCSFSSMHCVRDMGSVHRTGVSRTPHRRHGSATTPLD